MTIQIAMQDLAAPDGVCFGWGAQNAHGLRIKSYWDADHVHCFTLRPLCSKLVQTGLTCP
jgi:hypothetical protein